MPSSAAEHDDLSNMSARKQTVFVGRDEEVDFDDYIDMRQSVEQDSSPAPLDFSPIKSDVTGERQRSNRNSFSGKPDAKNQPPVKYSAEPSPELGHVNADGSLFHPASNAGGRQLRRATRHSAGESSNSSSNRNRNNNSKSSNIGRNKMPPKSAGTIGKAGTRAKRQAPQRSAQPAVSEQEYEIEKVVDERIDADTCEHFFRVRWKGWASKDDTWEPRKNLSKCQPAIEEFQKGLGNAKSGRK